MKAPRFWSNPPERPGWPARLLAPAAWLWRLGAWWRGRGVVHRVVPYRAPVPVVCIGNLTAGGAGKTPMVAALLERLVAQGRRPHVVIEVDVSVSDASRRSCLPGELLADRVVR